MYFAQLESDGRMAKIPTSWNKLMVTVQCIAMKGLFEVTMRF